MREFDAPRHLVFRAFTEPALIKRWWSGRRATVASIERDLRVGGSYRLVVRAKQGMEEGFDPAFAEVAFRGTFKELVPPERRVYTEAFEAQPAEETLVTATFDEHDDRTTLRLTIGFATTTRDLMAEQMEDGMQESYDVLDELLAEVD